MHEHSRIQIERCVLRESDLFFRGVSIVKGVALDHLR